MVDIMRTETVPKPVLVDISDGKPPMSIRAWARLVKIPAPVLRMYLKKNGMDMLVRFIRSKMYPKLEKSSDIKPISAGSDIKYMPTPRQIRAEMKKIREENRHRDHEESKARLKTYRHPKTYRISSDGRRQKPGGD